MKGDWTKGGERTSGGGAYSETASQWALVAAAINPKLAATKPAKAVTLARRLISAAQKSIDAQVRQTRREELAWRRVLKRFPDGERVSLSEAFNKWGEASGYKTEGGFVAALRAKNLTTEWLVEDAAGRLVDPFFKLGPAQFREITSKSAVDELCRSKREHKKKADRERKSRAPKENLRKVIRKSEPQKREAAGRERKSNSKKRNAVSQERKNRTLPRAG